jgi:glycosyltransferase involved in cell wall biosynthesis
VAGRGDESEKLKRLGETLGLAQRIDFNPWLSEDALARALANSALAVLPSRHESFGNAMAEAMAVGTPLVSTLAGSVPEVVKDGQTGLLVPPDSPDALAAAMRRLLESSELCLQLSSASRARVRENYTWDKVAERYANLYRSRNQPLA